MERKAQRLVIAAAASLLGCGTTVEPSYVTSIQDTIVGMDLNTKQPKTSPTTIATTALLIPNGLTSGATIFFQSDGTFAPTHSGGPEPIAKVYIEVEGPTSAPTTVTVSNEAVIDWRHSAAPVQHSFNLIGARTLMPGLYAVRLMAVPVSAREDKGLIFPFAVKQASLAVMRPRATVEQKAPLPQPGFVPTSTQFGNTGRLPDCLEAFTDEPHINNVTACAPDAMLDHIELTGLMHIAPFDPKRPWIVLASGTSYLTDPNRFGDAMWGLFVNNRHCGDQFSTWTVNDLQANSEPTAPMFVQGYFSQMPCRGPDVVETNCACPEMNPQPSPSSTFTVSLDVTKFPLHLAQKTYAGPGINPVIYGVQPGAQMVVLTADASQVQGSASQVQGSAPRGKDINSAVDSMTMQLTVPRALATGQIVIPPSHNGVVFFTAKSRHMGMGLNESGAFTLWIEIREGFSPPHVCDLTPPPLHSSPLAVQPTVNDSQRTLSASYLSVGNERLPPGNYSVTACGYADGNFKNQVVMTADVPLIWFDGDGTPR
jgi:hypothetical protein